MKKEQIAEIIEKQRAFFSTGATQDADFRILFFQPKGENPWQM